ncbi:MAG TPA: molybdopterin-binding protein [Xanthobacteraceae bacterium]|jgi:molybdopterin biosynthesis enzyme|nr:molybdopterin-binding protein [Xanthobacteraceae bacterium]
MVVEPDRPQRIARLTPLADVLARLEALVEPVTPRAAGLSAARGRTLAEDVVIPAPIPATARALRDGWAVRSDLTVDASGYAPAPLPSAVRLDVGEPLPGDADAVAPLDAVAIREGSAQALAPVGPGEGVLAAGVDGARGAVLLSAGRRLGGVEIALLAAAGIAEVRVRAPRLRLVRTRRGSDAVIDAAIGYIADAIGSQGGDALMAAPDDPANALADAGADAVIAIGGTGAGRRDVMVRTLASMGEVLVHGVALLPGETTALGTVGARPVLALPGRLDAALAAWHVLGRLMLARLAANQETPSMRSARLTHKVSSSVGLAELVPVRCAGLSATPIASGYVPLAALAQANGWILINADSEGYPAQSEVVIRPWP